MPYGKRKFKRRTTKAKRWARKKAKRRQQKLSVKTVETIAKKVARGLDNENVPALKHQITVGPVMSEVDTVAQTSAFPVGDICTLRGLFTNAPNHDVRLQYLWGPKCSLLEVPLQAPAQVNVVDSTRVSDQVFLKGILIRGNLILPSTRHRATFYFTLCRKKGGPYEQGQTLIAPENFIASPYNYNYKKDLGAIGQSMSVLKEASFTLRQNSGRDTGNAASYSDLYRPFEHYFKINKKIHYRQRHNDGAPQVATLTDLKYAPYEIRIWSDCPHLTNNNNQTLGAENYPQVQARVSWLYNAT